MSTDDAQLHVYEGSDPGEYQPAKTWLFHRLRLKEEFDEDFSLLNRDRDRAIEFADFYFGHPELRGYRRELCAELVVASAVDLIEPEPVDGDVPASDDVAETLVKRLIADPFTRHSLLLSVRREMSEAGFSPRLLSFVVTTTGAAEKLRAEATQGVAGAIIALGYVGRRDAGSLGSILPIIESLLASKQHVGGKPTAFAALKAVTLIGPAAPPVLPTLRSMLDAHLPSPPLHKREILSAFGSIGRMAVAVLLPVADAHADEPIRRIAIEALGAIGPDAAEALPLLERLADTDSMEARRLAHQAMERIKRK